MLEKPLIYPKNSIISVICTGLFGLLRYYGYHTLTRMNIHTVDMKDPRKEDIVNFSSLVRLGQTLTLSLVYVS